MKKDVLEVVLVVDDDADSSFMTAMALESRGYSAITAAGGDEAMTIVSGYKVRAVVMDLSMPGESGYDLAKRIRTSEGGEQIKLIALTGWSDDNARAQSAQAGFKIHLVKPVDIETLATAITGT